MSKKKDKIILDLETQAGENLVGWQKALADYQNLEKETDNRLKDISNYTKNNLVLDLLPIFDNYRTAITHIPEEEKKESWAIGLEHILKLWNTFLENNNINEIEALGKEFNHDIHESIGEIEDEEKEDQEIVEVKEVGYILKDKVIRPSKVIINNIERE